MKKILLIAPPFYRLMGSHFNGHHLGIVYIAAVLKQNRHDVIVYNADYQDSPDYANQRELFENYPSYKTALNDLTHPIWTEIKTRIASFTPDIIGISMLTANFKAASNIAKISKSLNKETEVVVGGAHPTLDPEGTIVREEFDYVIRGEGEFSFLELVEGRNKEDILGLSWKRNRTIVHNDRRPFIKDLDKLPFPARDSVLNGNDRNGDIYVATGRGCPFSCSYCASPQIWHGTTRYRSVPNVISELKHIKKEYNPSLVHFIDDTFNLNRHRTEELCRQIIISRLDLKWICDARADRLDSELLNLMKRAGCIRIKIGVESGSDRILRAIRKGLTRQKILRATSLIKESGIPLTIYLMAGFPGETNQDLRDTIELAKEVDADYYSLSILAPYYGTQIWDELEKSGKNLDKDHWEYFYHQSQDMIINNSLDPVIINEFLALNEREGKGKRI